MRIHIKIKLWLFVIFLFWAPLGLTNPTPETNTNPQYLNNEIEYLKKLIQLNANQMENLHHEMGALHRDQVNYKLEKDLLEKAYSASYQTINFYLAVLVAGLGVLGALSVRKLENDYKHELDNLKTLIVKQENELKEVAKLKESVEDLSNALSLKLMDIIEKAVHHHNNNNWPWAMEWVSKGLLIDPDNLLLLATKKRCLFYLWQWGEAAETSKKMVELTVSHPEHMRAVFELLEMLALNKDDDFDKYCQHYKPTIDKEYNYELVVNYLRLFKTIIDDDLEQTREILSPMCNSSIGASSVYGFEQLWPLNVAKYTLQSLKTPMQQKYLNTLINFYSGSIDTDGVKQILWPQDPPLPETEPSNS